MSITDTAAKIVESFKPIEVKTEIKNPVVNYKTQTNNFYFQSCEINREQLNQVIEQVAQKMVNELKQTETNHILDGQELNPDKK